MPAHERAGLIIEAAIAQAKWMQRIRERAEITSERAKLNLGRAKSLREGAKLNLERAKSPRERAELIREEAK